MKRCLAVPFAIAAAMAALFLSPAPASAQSETWVSGVGDDSNNCTRTAPCASFAGAISRTQINGEIGCLDSGYYGPVTIQKSITIDCHGMLATVPFDDIPVDIINGRADAGIRVAFDAFDPSDTLKTVHIRNLTINGFASAEARVGILLYGAGQGSVVSVENCVINGWVTGVQDNRTRGLLTVDNTTIMNSSQYGIYVPDTTSGSHRTTISNTKIVDSGQGIFVGTYDEAVIASSFISSNATSGIVVDMNGVASVHSTEISHNGTGMQVNSGGSLLLDKSNLSFNSTAGFTGVISTNSNNSVYKNGPLGASVAVGLQ
jgi:parallel beta helix pectate lyase-like protein